ncbi:MAG TPA: class I SAM-dependent methyltransferase [Alphaproteobacteria bacterium]|jgi:SAM-dependent methyltransferase
MAIDFHAPENRDTYAGRDAQSDWYEAMRAIVDPAGKRVADIGCGGGIYSAAWADIGAAQVVGIDFSAPILRAAARENAGRANVSFRQGDALDTRMLSRSVDVVFERALIHHLTDYDACFGEAHRLLDDGGLYIIQDRTPDDVRLPGAPDHLRGYFFERYPKLLKTELGRRPQGAAVERALLDAGFASAQALSLWETRRTYSGFPQLAVDLLARTGRSILHDLTDAELADLVDFIGTKMPAAGPITEQDRWTIWHARKPV